VLKARPSGELAGGVKNAVAGVALCAAVCAAEASER